MPTVPALPATFNCPVELALELLGGKWKPVIVAQLKLGPKRYADLRRLIPRLSDKMLTQRLHELVEHELVERDASGRYQLTERGESLRPVLDALYDWGLAIADELGARIVPVDPPTEVKAG